MHRIGPALVDVAAIGPDRSAAADALLASLVSALAPGSGTRIARRCPRCGGRGVVELYSVLHDRRYEDAATPDNRQRGRLLRLQAQFSF